MRTQSRTRGQARRRSRYTAAVNFLSHAVLAAARHDDAAYVLGSMLPDFASMAGLRIRHIEHHELARGVEFHHAGDDAFHGAPIFLDMMGDARDELEDDGVSMGAAMAVSHVGLELLLDGWLVAREGASTYRRALAHAHRLGHHVQWSDEEGEHRWQGLCTRLAEAPVPEGYVDADFVTERLERILARRPRLALQGDELDAVRQWTRRAKPRLWSRASELFEQVETRLER